MKIGAAREMIGKFVFLAVLLISLGVAAAHFLLRRIAPLKRQCATETGFVPHDVVLCYTTTIERIESEWSLAFVKNLLSLGCIDRFILNLPYRSYLTNALYTVPSWLQELGRDPSCPLEIYRCEDEGPVTKLLPTLRNRQISDEAYVIVADDDVMYLDGVGCALVAAFRAARQNPEKDVSKLVFTMCNASLMGYKSYGALKSTLACVLEHDVPPECKKVDDDFFDTIFASRKILYEAVPYNSDTSWTCSMDQAATDTHPQWVELLMEDRGEATETCRRKMSDSLST